jgi:hypothetical protein
MAASVEVTMFSDARRLTPISGRAGAHWVDVDPAWFQGRGAYGGLANVWLLDAMMGLVRPGRAARTLHVHCAAPIAAGRVEVVAERMREGARVSHASARIVRDGVVEAFGTATFAGSRAADEEAVPGPQAPPMDDRAPLMPLPQMPGVPAFCQFVTYAFGWGHPPYSGAPSRHFGGRCQFVGGARADAGMLAALADVWPPAELAAIHVPRPAATVDMTLRFAPSWPDYDGDAVYRYAVQGGARRDGYAGEVGHLWGPDGQHLLTVEQLVALL